MSFSVELPTIPSFADRAVSFCKLQQFEMERRAIGRKRLRTNLSYWIAFREYLEQSATINSDLIQYLKAMISITKTYYTQISSIVPFSSSSSSNQPQQPNQPPISDRLLPLDILFSSQTSSSLRIKEFVETIESRYLHTDSSLMTMASDYLTTSNNFISQGNYQIKRMYQSESLAQLSFSNLLQANDDYSKRCQRDLLMHQQQNDDDDDDDPVVMQTQVAESDIWIYDMIYRVAVAHQEMAYNPCTKSLSSIFSSMKSLERNRRMIVLTVINEVLTKQEELWNQLSCCSTTSLTHLARFRLSCGSDLMNADIEEAIKRTALVISSSTSSDVNDVDHDKTDIDMSSLFSSSASSSLDVMKFLLRYPVLSGQVDKLTLPFIAMPVMYEDDVSENNASQTSELQLDEDTSKQAMSASATESLSSYRLSSPMHSPLLIKSGVLELSSSSSSLMLNSWNECLIVATADRFLHVFNCSCLDMNKKLNSSNDSRKIEEKMFREFVLSDPNTRFMTSNETLTASCPIELPSETANRLSNFMAPQVSINLRKAEIVLKPGIGSGTCLQLIEQLQTSGLIKLFKATEQRIVSLRSCKNDQVELIEWIMILDKLKIS